MLRIPKKKFRHHSLTGRITPDTLYKAWRKVRANRGAAGVDKQSVQMFESNWDENLAKLLRELKSGTFSPLPLLRRFIEKGLGKFRPLGIPAVRDRVGQEMLRALLAPIFERLFHDSSHGFRRNRSCHTAMKELMRHCRRGWGMWIVEADIVAFFDNISHKLIYDMVAAEVADGKMLALLKKFLQAGVMEGTMIKRTRKGTPQGGVVSPLLANIVLNHLDWSLDKHGFKFVRYADDFVIVCKSRKEAEKALELIRQVIETELELQLHPDKTRIVRVKDGFDFLGYQINSLTVRMGRKAEDRFKDKIRQATTRHHNLDA
ncbi:MAG: group II intron reverse transcriptase/maturase [Lentisphaerales bacterium]|nr:MAG: group II intron reverse transcriptase/maturase [Lentisphaerales bacterium]